MGLTCETGLPDPKLQIRDTESGVPDPGIPALGLVEWVPEVCVFQYGIKGNLWNGSWIQVRTGSIKVFVSCVG